MNGCQISVFSGGSQTWKKVFLPPTIKYTPHPERAEKIKNKTTCSEGRGFHSEPGRNSFTQKHLVKLFSWSIPWGQGSQTSSVVSGFVTSGGGGHRATLCKRGSHLGLWFVAGEEAPGWLTPILSSPGPSMALGQG